MEHFSHTQQVSHWLLASVTNTRCMLRNWQQEERGPGKRDRGRGSEKGHRERGSGKRDRERGTGQGASEKEMPFKMSWRDMEKG